jgi:hypothetical protein
VPSKSKAPAAATKKDSSGSESESDSEVEVCETFFVEHLHVMHYASLFTLFLNSLGCK